MLNGDRWFQMMEMYQYWHPYPMANHIQTCYQSHSPQNPSMMMPQRMVLDFDMNEEQRDFDYWRQMYPEKVKKIQQYVSEVSEKEDYDDSFIYDEYPDPVAIQNLVQQVLTRLQEDKMFQKEESPIHIVSILLFQELHRRRCRVKHSRRKWY